MDSTPMSSAMAARDASVAQLSGMASPPPEIRAIRTRHDEPTSEGRSTCQAGGVEPLPLVVVDAANVVGSVPDGWWRDRAAATRRLRDELAAVAGTGLPGVPPPLELVLVVEGAARGVASVPGVRVVTAPGAGDD